MTKIYKEVKEICEPIIAKHMKDIPYRIEYVENGVKYLGKCVYNSNKGNFYTLKFSSIYFNSFYENGELNQIKDTVLHEVAHALTREIHGSNHRHDNFWKSIASKIGCLSEVTSKVNVKPYKYVYECPRCHQKFYRLRRLNGNYYCTECGKKYSNGIQIEEHKVALIEEYKQIQVIQTI